MPSTSRFAGAAAAKAEQKKKDFTPICQTSTSFVPLRLRTLALLVRKLYN
jgi:hypothetical protein